MKELLINLEILKEAITNEDTKDSLQMVEELIQDAKILLLTS